MQFSAAKMPTAAAVMPAFVNRTSRYSNTALFRELALRLAQLAKPNFIAKVSSCRCEHQALPEHAG